MDIKDYAQMMRYLTRPRDVVPDPSPMDQEPRNMYGQGSSVDHAVRTVNPEQDSFKKLSNVLGAYRRYRRGEKNPKINFNQFFELYSTENFATGGSAGQLVQPSNDGSRPGYRGSGDREYLDQLIKKANEGFKLVKMKDLQVKAGYSRSTNLMGNLDTLETKFKKAFNFIMNNPDKPVVDMFDPMTQVKKLVGSPDAPGRYLKGYAPYEEAKSLIKVLAIPKSKTKLRKAEGLTLRDLEFRIDNNIKGDVLFAPPKQVSSETKIMDIVDRHIKQGGTKIEWTVKPEITPGGSTSYGEARFKYNGKEYGIGELINNAKDDPNFKEFFQAQREYKTINDKIVEHPKTGKKIRFGNLMKEVYGDSVMPYNVDHAKSILDEPFTSLRVLPRRINTAAGNIKSFNEADITNPNLIGKYSDAGKEIQLKKIGYNYNQPINDLIEAELKLADDVLNKGRVLRKPNEITESIRKKENYVPDFYSKDAKPGKGFEKIIPEIKKRLNSTVTEFGSKSKKGKAALQALAIIAGSTGAAVADDGSEGTGGMLKDAAIAGGAVGTVATKGGRKLLGNLFNAAGLPGSLAFNYFAGIDGESSLDRSILGFELATAKDMIGSAVKTTNKIKNPILRKAAELVTTINPKYALNVAKKVGPIGKGIMGGELAYKVATESNPNMLRDKQGNALFDVDKADTLFSNMLMQSDKKFLPEDQYKKQYGDKEPDLPELFIEKEQDDSGIE